MIFELRRIIEIFLRYRRKFYFLWAFALAFTIVFYFISAPRYDSSAQILMENTRKPWEGFKQGNLPKREKFVMAGEEKTQTLTLRDPFWNFLYDQLEKTTYDFTPFFQARTTVFKVMDSTGSRQHFDNGAMTDEEIVEAFTQNLDVTFDRSGSYTIKYTFEDPVLARAIVNRYTELFSDFISQLNQEHNLPPSKAVSKIIEKLKSEIADIENRQAELKKKTGIIAPAQYFTTLTNQLYSIEMRLAKAEGTAKAAGELLPQAEENVKKMSSGKFGEDEIPRPAVEVLADPLLAVIAARIFWDAVNLAQAEMIYVDGTPQLEFWKGRLAAAKKILYQRMSEDERGRRAELLATYLAETGKSLALRQMKADIESSLDRLPGVEGEYVFLHRQKAAKRAALSGMEDLAQTGESYLQKGDKIAAVLDPAYLPKRKSEPVFWQMLLLVMFSTTLCGFGWFFIRENIEEHSMNGNS